MNRPRSLFRPPGRLSRLLSRLLPRPARRVLVEGPSMEPVLASGDRLLVLRRRRPRPGDIVALTDPRPGGRLIVKRVVAVTGDQLRVEGDNPSASTDSRHFGPVHRRAVLGRAVYRYGPPGRTGRLA